MGTSLFKPSILTGGLLLMTVFVFSQNKLGQFEGANDIGEVAKKGQVYFHEVEQEYLIEGGGQNMWFDKDEFHFLWKRLKGDFIVRTRAKFVGKGTNAHRKLGWMVRNSLGDQEAHVNACLHGDGLTSLQYRPDKSENTEEIVLGTDGADILQLERKSGRFIFSAAKDGEPFKRVVLDSMDLTNEVFVGLYVCSHENDLTEKAIFTNVRMVQTFGDDQVAYTDYLGSRLELLDIETAQRSILYETSHSIQAPNWSRDGQHLVYNSNGLLYSYELLSGKHDLINTSEAVQNNNDHVFSPDGAQIGISHHDSADEGRSGLFVLPSDGSTAPRRVTMTGVGASYLHDWSPDGKSLLFTGHRNDQYDIFSVDIASGKETQLTNTAFLDDGSEYGHDGKSIYFNSNRSGTMQIWKMSPDGSNEVQLTNDEFNDWFPHPSPDGKWLLFLSYEPEVDSADHPFYKQVYLRIMPINGGKPKIIAYLYGGQGTINVSSWSPDSKKVAFISNSGQ